MSFEKVQCYEAGEGNRHKALVKPNLEDSYSDSDGRRNGEIQS